MLTDDRDYIEAYFEGKDLGVSIVFQGESYYIPSNLLLEATLNSSPGIHRAVAQWLRYGSKESINRLMTTIAKILVTD